MNTQRFREFKTTCSSTLPTFSARSNSVKREMLWVKIQPYIRGFHCL